VFKHPDYAETEVIADDHGRWTEDMLFCEDSQYGDDLVDIL
jgi:hypothetical protein